ncbi:MAG: dienelactone hydrolase family protein, partial [Dehalococcoidia bacterium]
LGGLEGVEQGRTGLAGYSFGAVAAAAVAPADQRVQALALVSPPPLNLERKVLGRWQRPKLLAVGERDAIAPPTSLQEVADGLAEPRELLTFPGADHFWLGQTDELARAVAEFFRRWLAK